MGIVVNRLSVGKPNVFIFSEAYPPKELGSMEEFVEWKLAEIERNQAESIRAEMGK